MAKFTEWEPWEEREPPDPGPPPTHEVTDRHWLEVYDAEEEGAGSWDRDGDYDYEVTHECKWENCGGYWHPSCALQFEIDNIGSDVFDPNEGAWPCPPFRVEIKHEFHPYQGYEGDWDIDSWVEIVDER